MQNSLTGQGAEAKVGPVSQSMGAILTGALTLAALLFGLIAFILAYGSINFGDDSDHDSDPKLTCCFKASFSGLIFLIMMITTFVLLLPATALLKIGKPPQAMIGVALNALAAAMCVALVAMLIYNLAHSDSESAQKDAHKHPDDKFRLTIGLQHDVCKTFQKRCDDSSHCKDLDDVAKGLKSACHKATAAYWFYCTLVLNHA
jgi:hypothetical protein